MQDMIKEIVDMDRKAREITDAAQLEKVNSEKEVAERRERIREEYLARARKRIALNEPQERAAAEEEWKSKEAKTGNTRSAWMRYIKKRATNGCAPSWPE